MARTYVERIDPERVCARDAAYAAGRAIRHQVFVREQGVSADLEFDDLDDTAEHFVAWRANENQKPVALGVARMRRVGDAFKAERVAVNAAERGRGIGRGLMDAMEERARELGASALALHAQLDVIPFYEKLGYCASGPVFEEANILHRKMLKRFGAAPPRSTA